MSKPPALEELNVVSDQYMRDGGNTQGTNRRLSICRVLGQIYNDTEDEELKLKLRYVSTIARYYIYKLRDYDPEWVNSFCPRYSDYDKLMKGK